MNTCIAIIYLFVSDVTVNAKVIFKSLQLVWYSEGNRRLHFQARHFRLHGRSLRTRICKQAIQPPVKAFISVFPNPSPRKALGESASTLTIANNLILMPSTINL